MGWVMSIEKSISKAQAVQFINFLNSQWTGKSDNLKKYTEWGLILIGIGGSNFNLNDSDIKAVLKFMQKKSGKKVNVSVDL